MKTNKRYDIFISYRRDGGYETAQQISQYLKYKGYNVFFDLENLRESGKFNTRLISIIENCKDFIIVFPTTDTERLWNDDDWVRTELACAIRNDKNIVPILLRDFKFPKELPDDINEVRFYQGVAAGDHNYFDASMLKLRELLRSKRGFTWQRYKIAVVAIIGVLAATLSVLSFAWWSNQTEYKSLSKDICSTMGSEIIMINGTIAEIDEIEKDWKNYTSRLNRATNMTEADRLYKDFSDKVKYYRDKQRVSCNEKTLTENERKLLRRNKIEIADVEGFFNTMLPAYYKEIKGSLEKLLFYASPNNYFVNSESSNHFVELNFKSNKLSAEAIYLSYLGVMSLMPSKEINPIIDKIKINLYNLPQIDNDKPYTYYENRLQRINAELAEMIAKSENVVLREEDVKNRIETFIDDAKRQQNIKQGLEKIEEKKANVETKRGELAEADRRLTEAYERALTKFEITADDEQWYAWGKMLRIATLAVNAKTMRAEALKQYNEQVQIAKNQGLDPSFLSKPSYTMSLDEMFVNVDKWLNNYLKFNKAKDPNAVQYVATTKSFFKQVQKGAIPYQGILMVGTDNGAQHPVLRVGDIVVERKGKPVATSDDYGRLKDDPQPNTLKIIRFESGKMQTIMETVPADCKILVGFAELKESE